MDRGNALRAPWLFAVLVLLIAAETRFLGLDRHSLWFDEAYSVIQAKTSPVAIARSLHDNDTHPPLYYAVLSGWIRAFGSGEIAVRAPSAIIGFLTVPVLYGFASGMVRRELATAAAALLAGSAFAVIAAQEARMYALLGLLALLSWWSLRRAVVDRARWCWAGYVASAALMPYTHYFGFLVLGSQVVYLIPIVRRDRAVLRRAALAVGIALACFLPWLPSFLAQAASGRGNPTFRPPVGLRAVLDLLALFGFGGELFGSGGYFHTGAVVLPLWQEALLILPVVALVAAGIVALKGERAWCLLCYWAAPIAGAMLLAVRVNVFYTRYFSFLVPPFAVLLAAGVGAGVDASMRWVRRTTVQPSALIAAAVGVVLLVNAPVLNGYRWRGTGDYDWRGAARLVSSHAGPDDYLLFVPGFARIAFEYYYKGPQGSLELTPSEDYRMIRMKTIPKPSVDKAWARRLAEEHPRVWVIATFPVPAQAYARLGGLMADSFAGGPHWDFNGVFVWALSSRVSRKAELP